MRHSFLIIDRLRFAAGGRATCRRCNQEFVVSPKYFSFFSYLGSFLITGMLIYSLISLNFVYWFASLILILLFAFVIAFTIAPLICVSADD